MTPGKCKVSYQCFPYHQRQLLLEFRTKATSPRSAFVKNLAQLKTAAEESFYGVANTVVNKWVECQICLPNAETGAATWSIANSECIVNLLDRVIDGITLNKPILFKKELAIHLIQLEVSRHVVGVE